MFPWFHRKAPASAFTVPTDTFPKTTLPNYDVGARWAEIRGMLPAATLQDAELLAVVSRSYEQVLQAFHTFDRHQLFTALQDYLACVHGAQLASIPVQEPVTLKHVFQRLRDLDENKPLHVSTNLDVLLYLFPFALDMSLEPQNGPKDNAVPLSLLLTAELHRYLYHLGPHAVQNGSLSELREHLTTITAYALKAQREHKLTPFTPESSITPQLRKLVLHYLRYQGVPFHIRLGVYATLCIKPPAILPTVLSLPPLLLPLLLCLQVLPSHLSANPTFGFAYGLLVLLTTAGVSWPCVIQYRRTLLARNLLLPYLLTVTHILLLQLHSS